jgi:hypothetical protein
LPTPYTADPEATQPPSGAPAWGVLPVINLPADGDPPNASTWEQAFKALNDHVGFILEQRNRMIFGSGVDGVVSINNAQQINGPKEYQDLTITSTGVVEINAPIWVRGTLTVDTGGVLKSNGQAGSNPAAGVGFDTGTEPVVHLRAGTSGGAGGASGGANGAAGVSFSGAPVTHSALGGAGGASTTNAGGAAGVNSSIDAPLSDTQPTRWMIAPGVTIGFYEVSGAARWDWVAVGGGTGGGGGGGGGGASGGGGGAGGGTIWVAARKIVLASATSIQALGGPGSAAGGAGGGAGGGGGGRITLLYGLNDGTLLSSAAVAGGAGGAGGNAAGTAGSNGKLIQVQVA